MVSFESFDAANLDMSGDEWDITFVCHSTIARDNCWVKHAFGCHLEYELKEQGYEPSHSLNCANSKDLFWDLIGKYFGCINIITKLRSIYLIDQTPKIENLLINQSNNSAST